MKIHLCTGSSSWRRGMDWLIRCLVGIKLAYKYAQKE